MNPVREISQRLSLRTPLAESLALLAELVESGAIPMRKDADLAAALAQIKARVPGFESFERDFPSLCFALATGVGKTRLMAAIICWLFRTSRSRHFLVLAPNLTIYEKLKRDFDPGNSKYLFRGLPEFAVQQPQLVTGEDWDSGIGVRFEDAKPMTIPGQLFPSNAPVINIFNIAKINSRGAGADKTARPRMRRMQEYLGQSYFEYLSNLPDLVVLMDEAHRYRADAGARSIDELKPVLGIELTATPKATGVRAERFKNIAYSFPLGSALLAGYVKEPTVATRKDFDPKSVPSDELERIKLTDGVHVHEQVKLELLQYFQSGQGPLVNPFMLVVASDTAHAAAIKARIEASDFFDGRYQGKVIEIHSKTAAAESDENTAKLLRIEQQSDTEIVIHVDKLKEGWDVANLFTIVPLRASAAEILTEQTIGRGLRLPFSKRTGVAALDRLTIIAHDKFRDIIDRANQPDSLIKQTITVGAGGDIDPSAIIPIASVPTFQNALGFIQDASLGKPSDLPSPSVSAHEGARENLAQYRLVNQNAHAPLLEAVDDQSRRVSHAMQLLEAPHLDEVIRKANARLPVGSESTGISKPQLIAFVREMIAGLIEIPTITLQPKTRQQFRFLPFQMANLDRIKIPAIDGQILLQELRTGGTDFLSPEGLARREPVPENYLVAILMARDEIDYDSHAQMLFDLAAQVVNHLHSYLADEDAVHNVLQYSRRKLADLIWLQMQQHMERAPVEFSVKVTRGFAVLRARPLNSLDGFVHAFHAALPAGAKIRNMVFGGFKKCCFNTQKFDSDEGEFQLVRLLERDNSVLKWLKPAADQFVIEYHFGKRYHPDFVVETQTERLIVELKRADWEEEPNVQAKAAAAAQWCKYASQAAAEIAAKPWAYLLIPHDGFGPQSSLDYMRKYYVRDPQI